MKFSFFMMPMHDPRENPTLAFQRDIALVHLADKLGFDEFYIGEHHSGGWETMPAPEMALAMAAANAHRIKLGTSVFSAPFHHPFHLAERMCFLDHLTHGRAILGVGPCSLVTDKMLFNMDDKALYPMLHEAINVIVRLLETPSRSAIKAGSGSSRICACSCARSSSRDCPWPCRPRRRRRISS